VADETDIHLVANRNHCFEKGIYCTSAVCRIMFCRR